MLNEFFRFSDFIQYLITARGRHGLHSPFVYRLNEEVIRGKAQSPAFDMIETLRSKMIKSKTKIEYTDFGSGNKSGLRALSEIAANTAKTAKYCKLLYRIVNAVQPEYAIELGTGSGIATLYQAAALSPERPLHTIEGSEKLVEIAGFNAQQCGLDEHIRFYAGEFGNILPALVQAMPRIDYAFIDGNHRFEPTVDYFEMMLPKIHDGSVLVFDDIYWSEDMKRAWNVIRKNDRVTVSVDVFQFGVVFFRPGQEKEHFTIRY